MLASITQWWHGHKWGVWLVFAATIAMAWVGATWLLFLFYIVSFGLLLYVLTSLAKLGLGNRLVIGQSCLMGLVFLGQVAGFQGSATRTFTLSIRSDCSRVFLRRVGCVPHSCIGSIDCRPRRRRRAEQKVRAGSSAGLFAVSVGFPDGVVHESDSLAGHAGTNQAYVESFDRSPLLQRQLAAMGNRGALGGRIEA